MLVYGPYLLNKNVMSIHWRFIGPGIQLRLVSAKAFLCAMNWHIWEDAEEMKMGILIHKAVDSEVKSNSQALENLGSLPYKTKTSHCIFSFLLFSPFIRSFFSLFPSNYLLITSNRLMMIFLESPPPHQVWPFFFTDGCYFYFIV